MITVTRTLTDVNPQNLYNDLKKGSLSDKFSTILTINHKTWEVVMQFTPDFDENDETALDVILAAHNNVSEQVPIIMSLADKSVRNKSHTAINFVTELEDGVAFHKEVEFFEETPKRGHIKYERYYHGYEDVDNKGQEVVRVSYDWTMDQTTSVEPAGMSTIKRDYKQMEWMKPDGTYHSKKKCKPAKKYDTFEKQSAEGIRRRQNIIAHMKAPLGTAMVFSGAAADMGDVNLKLVSLWKKLSAELSAYIESGKATYAATGVTDVYQALIDDTTFAWLNNVVPDNATTQATIPLMVGKSIRNITIDKLKGLI